MPPVAPISTERTRKRKSTPYRSPCAHSLNPGAAVTSTINVSQLLRVLARDHKHDQLDHQRYRPSAVPLPRPAAPSPDKKKHSPREQLVAQDSQFGRGKRSQNLTRALTRGRSPGIPPPTATAAARAKGKTSLTPVGSASSSLKRSRSQESHHLVVPPPSSSSSRSPPLLHPAVSITMNRSTSLGTGGPSTPGGPASLSASTTSPTESLVVINSPLARSFTSNGKGEIEERLVVEGRRSRQSSAGGSAYVSPRPSPRSAPAVAVGGLQVAA